jgi:hypothetical protein
MRSEAIAWLFSFSIFALIIISVAAMVTHYNVTENITEQCE